MARTNFTLPDELNKRADEEAKRLTISKAALINMALNQYFQQKDAMAKMPDLIESIKELTQAVKAAESLQKGGRKRGKRSELAPLS